MPCPTRTRCSATLGGIDLAGAAPNFTWRRQPSGSVSDSDTKAQRPGTDPGDLQTECRVRLGHGVAPPSAASTSAGAAPNFTWRLQPSGSVSDSDTKVLRPGTGTGDLQTECRVRLGHGVAPPSAASTWPARHPTPVGDSNLPGACPTRTRIAKMKTAKQKLGCDENAANQRRRNALSNSLMGAKNSLVPDWAPRHSAFRMHLPAVGDVSIRLVYSSS